MSAMGKVSQRVQAERRIADITPEILAAMDEFIAILTRALRP